MPSPAGDPWIRPKAAAAFTLLRDYDNEWDLRCDVWHRRVARHSEREIFAAAQLTHTPFDILYLDDLTGDDALARCPVVIYPHPMIMTRPRAELLRRYVEKGGTLILGCRAGLKDRNGRAVMLPQPGLLQELTGTDVRDFGFESPAEEPDPAHPVFHDILTPLEGTAVLDRYRCGFCAGEVCLTEKRTGLGRTLHLGSAFSRETAAWLFAYTGVREPFRKWVEAPEGVELVMREKDGKRWLFALNYQASEQRLFLPEGLRSLLTGERAHGETVLPPFGTAVFALPDGPGADGE